MTADLSGHSLPGHIDGNRPRGVAAGRPKVQPVVTPVTQPPPGTPPPAPGGSEWVGKAVDEAVSRAEASSSPLTRSKKHRPLRVVAASVRPSAWTTG